MLKKEDYRMIEVLKKRGVYLKDIAEELGVHPKTVKRALKRGDAPAQEHKKTGSKLAPYKQKIDQMLSEDIWNTRVILREIQEEGYTGSYTILREYVQPKRPLRASRATVRFETEPGQQLQSDWGSRTPALVLQVQVSRPRPGHAPRRIGMGGQSGATDRSAGWQ